MLLCRHVPDRPHSVFRYPSLAAVLGLLVAQCAVGITAAHAHTSVCNLTCEYLHNPVGMDIRDPRLSWMLQSDHRGEKQTSYQVLVASTKQNLTPGKAELWDSGRLGSDQNVHVVYRGKPLKSDTTYWWKVRIWDKDSRPSDWSEPAFWSMGLTQRSDWKARWIGRRAEPASQFGSPGDARWIWFPETIPANGASVITRYFRKLFEVNQAHKVRNAWLWITADDSCTVFINGQRVVGIRDWWVPSLVDVTKLIVPGKNVLAVAATNDNRSPAGLICRLVIGLDSGDMVTAESDKTWLTSDMVTRDWQSVSFRSPTWKYAKELGQDGCQPWGRISTQTVGGEPSPLFRKAFAVVKPVRSAHVYVCGLGYHELHLNGRKVGDHVLEPGFTRYDRRALYVTYDVTKNLRQGMNALGVMLGNGWFNSATRDVWDFDKAPWRNTPRLILQLQIRYIDGSTQAVVSDSTWSTSAGPITFNAIRNGETYDARLEQPGWDTPGYQEHGWQEAVEVEGPTQKLVAQKTLPNRVVKLIKPVTMTEPKPGVFVFNMGQNLAGWCRIKVSGSAGTTVTIRYDERLNSDGSLNQCNGGHIYSGHFQTDTYVLKGKGVEVWEPRFVYHGFQYVEVEGLSKRPCLDSVTACVVCTAFSDAGKFECSNSLLNKIQRNTLWSYKSNFATGYPTDCPHREKNGWTGDAHLAAETGLYNFNPQANYTKWIDDFEDAQHANGDLPGIVPTSSWGYGNGPAWDSALILIPWYVYLYAGDRRILEEHYPSFKRYVDYLTSRASGGIVPYGLGDWCPPVGGPDEHRTPSALTSTAYYYVDVRILAEVARMTGKTEDARIYAALAESVAKSFNDRFYNSSTGVYTGEDQTAMSTALYQGLVKTEEKRRVLETLIRGINANDGHLSTGILGTKYVLHVLSENGRTDLAYAMATKRTFPSWGYWVQQGATTLWEQWNGVGSHNHIMFGDISAWFCEALAGITADPGQPGFEHIIVRPNPINGLKWVKAEHMSMYGLIRSAWEQRNGELALEVTIPANTYATVYLPSLHPARIIESGKPLSTLKTMEPTHVEGNSVLVTVGSGDYRFVVRE